MGMITKVRTQRGRERFVLVDKVDEEMDRDDHAQGDEVEREIDREAVHPQARRWVQHRVSNKESSVDQLSEICAGLQSDFQPADAYLTSKWKQESASSNARGPESETEKCSMESWENVLPDASPEQEQEQEQSISRWIIGDVDDFATASLSKVLQIGTSADASGSAAAELGFHGGFGTVDYGFAADDDQFGTKSNPSISAFLHRSTAENLDSSTNSLNIINFTSAAALHHHQQDTAFDSSAEIKPPIFNPQFLINQHQSHHNQNPSFSLPFPFAYPQHQGLIGELHGHVFNGCFWDTGQEEVFIGSRHHKQGQLQRPSPNPKPKTGVGDELGQHSHQQHRQLIIDQLYKAAEMVQMGNPVIAQGILARLNHHLSPVGNPFQRAAFYCKEALQSALLNNGNNPVNPASAISSPINIVFKISAYRSFCEISPLLQFTNFTCNQALLEVLDGFDRIHVFDFDIGYGGQWASLMQELAIRGGGAILLKITAVVSPSMHDQLELALARDNLVQFAGEINIGFEFEAVSINSLDSRLWPSSFNLLNNNAVAVHLPIGCLATHQLSPLSTLQFVKQLSPRIILSVERGCDRTDLPFASQVIHALQSYSNLIESLNAVNVNMDSLLKIEKFLLKPGIEKIVMGRILQSPEKSQHWRSLFLSAGFSPVTFSNFTESQADCIVKRTHFRGFHVEKKQSSLVLCWQWKELISATVWRCR
ncbi:scarecrow-like protein 6 [Andrographis paniculata]|uniref:scarecrow-like protein 6 n=1 Tax=Andrographis paniculata TaxID=175694 RepID=UPI0021E74A49|nr:scarecrow-like protein 6 [Andrographis paniculata]